MGDIDAMTAKMVVAFLAAGFLAVVMAFVSRWLWPVSGESDE